MGIWLNQAYPTPSPFNGSSLVSAAQGNSNGVFAYQYSNKLSNITDGTSNTIALGEIAYGLIPPTAGQTGYDIWAFSGYTVGEGGVVSSMYGVNLQKRFPTNLTNYVNFYDCGTNCGNPYALAMSVGSFHPGGANVGMADGSVRFLKETIASFPANAVPSTNYATSGPGPYLSGATTYGMFKGPMPVFNALSTAHGGEVVGSDGY
jgi:prepilin-type processing-associated H-X9-DG protein